MTNLKDFIESIQPIFEDDTLALEGATKFKELKEWDSLVALSLISVLDSEYNFQTSMSNIEKCDTLEDLYHLVFTK